MPARGIVFGSSAATGAVANARPVRIYNPLSVDELGRNAARALMGYPRDTLPPRESFNGAGVYTVHYTGSFGAYAGLREDEPIYVGKADLPGKRQGRNL